MISFKHSGDLGDIIYSLPAVRELCEGSAQFFLSMSKRTRQPMDDEQMGFIGTLLNRQDYIDVVAPYKGESICFDLDYFRDYWAANAEFGVSLAEWHCRAFGVDPSVVNHRWLEVEEKEVAPVVIHRSERYHNPEFPWKRILETYRGQSVFVGLRREWEKFTEEFGSIPYYKVRDAMEMSEVIEGAKLFIGNQSLPNAIAEGLKKTKILEVFMTDPNCCFERSDAQHIFTRNVYLPRV